jgi:hypothetical protein
MLLVSRARRARAADPHWRPTLFRISAKHSRCVSLFGTKLDRDKCLPSIRYRFNDASARAANILIIQTYIMHTQFVEQRSHPSAVRPPSCRRVRCRARAAAPPLAPRLNDASTDRHRSTGNRYIENAQPVVQVQYQVDNKRSEIAIRCKRGP